MNYFEDKNYVRCSVIMEEVKNETKMARACIKCREFVIIDSSNPRNQALIKYFEKLHKSHNLITLERDELQGHYKEIT